MKFNTFELHDTDSIVSIHKKGDMLLFKLPSCLFFTDMWYNI